MDLALVKALLLIVKYCIQCDNCKACVLKSFCGKIPVEW